MAHFTANFPELMETRSKQIFFKNYTMQELMFPKLFQRKPSTKSHEDRIRYAGLGTFQLKNEGQPVAFSDGVEGDRIRTVHQTFALGVRATWEALADDQWDVLDRMPSDLGESAYDHQENLAWSLIDDGYGAVGTFTGLDGLELFSNVHVLLRGGTGSNELVPPVALSTTGIEDAITLMRTTVGEEGRFINVNNSRLLYGPALAHTAYVLLQTERRVGTNEWDKSTVATTRTGITPVVPEGVPYLASDTHWSLHAEPGKNSLVWNDREKLFYERAKDNLTFDQLHWAAYRASVMFSEWRGNLGGNP